MKELVFLLEEPSMREVLNNNWGQSNINYCRFLSD